ncbi:DUF4212 domain-containing protein [Calderihabitans maritimus]|uniref:Membrane protein n=1 Tax=Calderihabitans maritimus TaxID=1246530 RepID=A0A1Z5HSL8_9FIRM|nr:DUF4212 domain-containing protein [Calderihabitans maritimus]GAW92523.1 membrane protein [Calderihabitans maritimus]
MEQERRQAYWRKNIGLIRNLLIIWALVSYVAAIFLANPFYNIRFFGIPLSFWFAQQGSMLVFVILIFYYSWRMDRLDEEYDVQEVRYTGSAPKSKEVSG